MNPDLLKKVIDTLEWAMHYAEHGHELMYPGEWYEEDGYVAQSVTNARAVLAELQSIDPRRIRVISKGHNGVHDPEADAEEQFGRAGL